MNFAVRRLIAGQELKSGHPRFAVIVPAQPAVYKASNVKKKNQNKNWASTGFLETPLAKKSHKNL